MNKLTVVRFSAKAGASMGKTSLGSGDGFNSPGVLECSPIIKRPRAKFLPVETQSTQLTVYSTFWYSLLQLQKLIDAVELDVLAVQSRARRSAAAEAAPR